jgi:hypothetical protein
MDKENLKRLEKGISETIVIIEDYIKSNEEKSEALRNIFNSCKNLERVNFAFDEKFPKEKNNQKLKENIEVLYNLYDKNKTYSSLLESNVLHNLKKYYLEVVSLREIFDRKEKIEENFRNVKNKNHMNNLNNEKNNFELSGYENLIENLYKQLYDELNFFKLNREEDLLHILKNFFSEKKEFDKEVLHVFENEQKSLLYNNNIQENFNKNRKEEISDYIK